MAVASRAETRSLPDRVRAAQALEQVGRFQEARNQFAAMLRETERAAPNSSDVAALLNNLGTVEADLGHYAEAERFYRDSLKLFQQTSGENDVHTVSAMLSLGGLYVETQRPELAKPLLQRALEICTSESGSACPLAAEIFEATGIFDVSYGRYEEAEAPLQQALVFYERRFGKVNVNVAYVLDELARAEMGAGNDARALANAEQSLAVVQALPQPIPRPVLVKTLNLLAAAYCRTGRMEEADSLFRQALATAEEIYGLDHPVVAYTLRNYSSLLEKLKRNREAKKLTHRADLILAQSKMRSGQAYTVDVSEFVRKK